MSARLNLNPTEGSLLSANKESNDPELNAPKNMGWNIMGNTESSAIASTTPNYLMEVQVTHKQITERFVELLTIFEDYTKMMGSERKQLNPHDKLKRTQSEQFIAAHTQLVPRSIEFMKNTVSLNKLELSDTTLLAPGSTSKVTCEVSSQTSWTVLLNQNKSSKLKPDDLKGLELFEQQQHHTLHIEVESISSTTALQRAPLHQRLWAVLTEVGNSVIAGFSMMGENFTYVLFVVLCLWCLYLIIAHYYAFMESSNVGSQSAVKPSVGRIRAYLR